MAYRPPFIGGASADTLALLFNKMSNIHIYDFVNKELEHLRQECNFNSEELEYFNLRAKHYSNQQIAIKMNVSEGKVSKLASSVKKKICRVL